MENVEDGVPSSEAAKRYGERPTSMYLVWEDLSVVLPNSGNGHSRKLLNGITGSAEPGRLLAIMGPSGSGKTTLLDSLAGRLSTNCIMTGNILLNGKKKRAGSRGPAYVTQDDVLLGTLTVRETITYSAHLRLPSTLTGEEIEKFIEEVIIQMGLQDCSDRVIGNWHLRGISNGERKRVSIAIETITKPSLLFLDEPTSGLDSASAFFVVQTLCDICQSGRTVISVIHQPSSEVFTLFDDLCLLADGQTVYFGRAEMATEFFAETGFLCPRRRNPSDHFLCCINTDFDTVTTYMGSNRSSEVQTRPGLHTNSTASEIKALLVEKYRFSKYASISRARVEEILKMEGMEVPRSTGSRATWRKQLSTLTRRSFVNMSRDVGYYWLRIAIYIVVSLAVGSIFFNVGKSFSAIFARGSSGAFLAGFMTFMSIGGFPSFTEELKIFYRERLNGHYGVAVYTIANFLSASPFLAMMSLATSAITNYMVKYRPGISHFMYIWLDLFGSIAVVESSMMVIAALVPNFMMGVILGAGYVAIMMMTSGYFRFLADLPKVFWRYPISYINYGAWALQGVYKDDMIGLEFDPLVPGDPKLKGEAVLTGVLRIDVSYSKWWDLAAIAAIFISCRLLFFTILKFKERVSPFIKALLTKRTLQRLSRRPSFRKLPPFPSQRYQNLRPLSSLEGLDSPAH
ncbi:hypothetical protein SAY87_016765 [Trapa incisa]|uniref:ABC transporter domain-containing protein n=1 Tax=Trapa incisa TaxID=236973 RepID=A0AAN7LAM9_9MYRT|nr:hypothetical protein SAY87_016765 [Trapa incisa]